MIKELDKILTNEYLFTFIVTFLSIFLKGISNKSEKFKEILRGEAFDFGPELVFIALSFAVSKLSQIFVIPGQEKLTQLLHIIILNLFLLIVLVILLKRQSVDENGKTNPLKGLYIPMLLGFGALFLVLTITLGQ
ncbi:MAG: hypothetical protein MUF42_17020 [Cytophagaceae bacterium]|jgi:hypothetical protein|nr:hypothetical protein [Cytophagaceae bacterium]